MADQEHNLAFIDGQNLHMGTTKIDSPWHVDFKKLRIYLKDKYNVTTAYYFLGFVIEDKRDLYLRIQEAGFVLVFREHNSKMLGKKKGNVDADIVFEIMKKLYRNESFDKIVLLSGDGDYYRLVNFLLEENRFLRVLFPNKQYASSLYKSLGAKYFAYLDNEGTRKKIEKIKRVP